MIHISDSESDHSFGDDIESDSADSSFDGWGDGSRKRSKIAGSTATPNPSGAGEAAKDAAPVDNAGDEVGTKPAGDEKKVARKAPKKKTRKDVQTSMSLVLGKKYPKSYLMEVGNDVDLTGDIATIGMVHVDVENRERPVKLDLKGILYRGTPRKCNTFAVVDIVNSNTTTTIGGAQVQVQVQEAKVTHVITNFLCMDKADEAEREVVYEGDLDDLYNEDGIDYKTSEMVTAAKKDAADKPKGKGKAKGKAKPKKRKAPATKKTK